MPTKFTRTPASHMQDADVSEYFSGFAFSV